MGGHSDCPHLRGIVPTRLNSSAEAASSSPQREVSIARTGGGTPLRGVTLPSRSIRRAALVCSQKRCAGSALSIWVEEGGRGREEGETREAGRSEKGERGRGRAEGGVGKGRRRKDGGGGRCDEQGAEDDRARESEEAIEMDGWLEEG